MDRAAIETAKQELRAERNATIRRWVTRSLITYGCIAGVLWPIGLVAQATSKSSFDNNDVKIVTRNCTDTENYGFGASSKEEICERALQQVAK